MSLVRYDPPNQRRMVGQTELLSSETTLRFFGGFYQLEKIKIMTHGLTLFTVDAEL